MARNGGGVYTLPQPPFTPGTTISSTAVNSDLLDIATALTGSVAADGQTTITGAMKNPSGSAGIPGVSFAADTTTGLYLAGAKLLGVTTGGIASANFDGNKVGTGQDGQQFYYGNGAYPNPVGVVSDFAGATAPPGWLLCFGQVVAQALYPELFFIIAATYNTGGEGAGNFRLPDCRGRVSAGKDNMGGVAANRIGSVVTDSGTIVGATLGSVGGSSTHVQTSAELATHNHGGTTGGQSVDHTHTYTGGSNQQASTGGTNYFNAAQAPGQTTGGTSNDHTHSISAAGSSTAMALLQPTIIFNKIIFAGRP